MASTLCCLTIRFLCFCAFLRLFQFSFYLCVFAALREIFCLLFCGTGGSLEAVTIENRPGLRAGQELEIIMGCTVRRTGLG
jgi:hypothetical protein